MGGSWGGGGLCNRNVVHGQSVRVVGTRAATVALRRLRRRPMHQCCHTAAAHSNMVCLLWLVQEVNDIRAGMEKAKNDIIKSTIAIMGTFSAIAFTITRLVAS